MINLQSQIERGRLFKAIKTSREALQPFRTVRTELIRDYVGSWYTKDGARQKTLVNLLNQTAKIYSVCLAANNPHVYVSTCTPEKWPYAKRFEVALNKLISDMQLHTTFRAVVMDAFFSIGCAVVMMRDTDTRFHGMLESEEDVWLDPGEPWLNRVSIDNLILDMSAKEISKMRYCGHEYRADFEKVKKEPGYDKKVVAKLTATSKNAASTTEYAQDIGTGGDVDDDELKPMIWLQDVWIPENQTVATFARDQDLPPLIERPWTGSQGGPYKFLSLGLVPDGLMPSSPASNLKGLHDLQNRLHVKMELQSHQQKTVNTYAPGGESDADNVGRASHGKFVKVRDPKNIGQVTIAGVDPGNQAFSMAIQGEYDRFAGNLLAMGGLGAQAGTVGQEEIIQGNVSRMETDMRLAVVLFAAECCSDLGHLMVNDENLEVKASHEVGAGVEVDASWPVKDENGERVPNEMFEDCDIMVEAFSMVFKSPEQKLQELFGVMNQLAPLWPMMQSSGISIDGQEIVEQISNLLNRPELKRILTFSAPAQELGGDENTIRQSPVTSRETVRRNVPTGGTADSRSSILQQALLGGDSQATPAQMQSLSRSPA
jgi:hypothetical protein